MSLWEKYRKYIIIILAIITIIGWIAFWGIFLGRKVWTEEFGYSLSPERIWMEYLYGLVACLPFGLFWMYYSTGFPHWLTPPGRYAPGMRVRVWSPYMLTATAIHAAAFAAAGLGEYIRVDLQALTVAFASAFFGSIPAFLGLWFGQIICRIWFVPFVWGGGLGFIDVVAWTTMDAAIWAYAGVIYFKFYHDKPNWRRVKRIVICMLLAEPVHQFFWFLRYWIVNPYEAAIASVIADWTSYWNISWILVLIGLTVGAGLREAMARR